jgi:hypothetical protein
MNFWQTTYEIRSNFVIIEDIALYEMTEIQTGRRIYNFDKLSKGVLPTKGVVQ